MLPALENTPHNEDDWNHWSFDHRDSHDRIRKAIFAQYGINLTDFQVDPISSQDLNGFLQNNAQLHTDMNGILKLENSDIQDVDITDPRQLAAFIRLHYLEHFYAERKLGI